jgi:hypothetical protein
VRDGAGRSEVFARDEHRGSAGTLGVLDVFAKVCWCAPQVVGRWCRFVSGGVSYVLVLSGLCRRVLPSGFLLATSCRSDGGGERVSKSEVPT